jgi:23S rRNA (adenine2503-C2)-methyltransferase
MLRPGMVTLLKNHTSAGLHERLRDSGVSARAARRIQAAVIRSGRLPPAQPGLPARVLDAVRASTAIPRLERLEKTVSPADGFAKYLFRGAGPDPFEAVRIPILHRPHDRKFIVCVSSQVGCGLGCAFCATGRMGFRRNLEAWEIVDQVLSVQADSPHPVRGVVFMGMGEPLLNYDAVLTAASVFSEPCGLAINSRSITISTAGIVPGIRRFTTERRRYSLIVSLTTANPARRAELLPVERVYPTAELLAALREHQAFTRRRVTLAWIMISGLNVGEPDARELAELTRGLPVKVDLIDVNDPTGEFTPPSSGELNAFRDALRKHIRAPVLRRYSGGADIHAACGMLAGGSTGEGRLAAGRACCDAS